MNEHTCTEHLVKDIKQRFRLIMDGHTAASMRQKGSQYALNWGASQLMLAQMAAEVRREVTADSADQAEADKRLYHLAVALMKEDIRECKLLATMLMPEGVMLPEVACLWVEQTRQVEVAEAAAMHVYQHLPQAGDLAYRWIASADELTQLTGYHVLSRLFMRGMVPAERAINELTDQALAALASPTLPLRHAAMNTLQRFADLGLVYRRMARGATRKAGYDFI
ncbi:MAG: DNA alkylation repair protein [Prevotella sp.]|nr:DNA alkylation repair protein [Prevotella sp.]